MSNTFIKFLSALILLFVISINAFGNIIGVGDIIPTGTETTLTETSQEESNASKTTVSDESVPSESSDYSVEIYGVKVCFGLSKSEITNTLGNPTETISEYDKDGNSYISLVYATDYTKMSVLQFYNGIFKGVYTVDKSAEITDGSEIYSIKNGGQTSYDKISITEYKDSHNENEVYAIYASYDGFVYRSNRMTQPAGQEKLIFYVTNAIRAVNGLYAYSYSEDASVAARLHSEDMERNDYFDHTSPDGTKFYERLSEQGVSFSACGENIACGYSDPFHFVHGWYNSDSGHRESILSKTYLYLGVGYSCLSGSAAYATQDFYA